MSSNFAKVFHATSLFLHLNAFRKFNQLDYSKATDLRVQEMETFGLRYFTTWNMVIQVLYLTMALYIDLRPLFTRTKPTFPQLETIKGYVFSIMFPCSLYIGIMFWLLFAINRDWVLPEVADVVVPKWLNHSVHTYIIVVLLVESLITSHKIPSFKAGCIGLTVLGFSYIIVIAFTYIQFGRWIYGIFYVLDWPQRIMYMIFTNTFGYVLLKVGIEIQAYKNRNSFSLLKKEL